jgi:hypothetical protein
MKPDNITLLDDLDIVNPEPAVRESNGLSFPSSPGAGVHFNSSGGFTASPHIKFLGTINEYDSGTQWLARRNNSWHEFQLVSHQTHDRLDWVVYQGGSSSTNKSSLEFPAFRTNWNGKVVEIECWYSPATGAQVSRIREYGDTVWTTVSFAGVTTAIAELAAPDTQMLCLGGINENVTTAPFIYKGVMGYLELRDFDADTLLHRWVPSVVSDTLYDTSGNGGHLALSGGIKETSFGLQDFLAHNHSKGFGTTSPVDFTLAVVPDMQESSDGRLALWDDVSDWLDTNSDEYQAIICTGDLVNHGNNQTQFNTVTPWITTIDALGKPFLLCAGNHDYTGQGNPVDHTATMFDVAWGQSRLQGKPWWDGGFESSNARNYFSKHILNGFKVMVVVVDWVPLKTTISWAKSVMSSNSDYSVVFLNHACLGPDGYIMSASDDYDAAEYQIYNSSTMWTAEETWAQIKSEPNLRVIVAGHIFDAAAVSPSQELVADDGHIVTTHVCNFHDSVGNENEQGYIQLLNFTVDGTVVTVKTISTVTLDEPSSSQYSYTKTGAVIPQVFGERIPALEDESAAADGSAITYPGGKVHNYSESKLQQVAMAQKVLALNGDFAENIDGWGESDLVLSWDAGRLKGVRVKTSQTLLSTIGGAPTAAMVYTVTFDLDYPEVNDSIQVSVGGGSLFGIDVTQGLASYSIDVTAGATAQTVKFNLDMSTGGSIVYFDNIVVKERDALPAYDVFGAVANFYGDGSTTWDKKTYAQLDAQWLVNGDLNLWVEKEGNSFIRAVQYPMDQLFSQENALANIDDFGTGGTVLYDTGGLPQVDSNGYVIYTS